MAQKSAAVQTDCALNRPFEKTDSEAALLALLLASLDVAAAIAQLVVAQAVVLKVGKNVFDRRFGDVVQGLLR